MQNNLKRNNMYLEGFKVILISPRNHTFSTILNLLVDIHIEKITKNLIFCRVKKRVLPYVGGGSESCGHVCNYQVIFDTFLKKSDKKIVIV